MELKLKAKTGAVRPNKTPVQRAKDALKEFCQKHGLEYKIHGDGYGGEAAIFKRTPNQPAWIDPFWDDNIRFSASTQEFCCGLLSFGDYTSCYTNLGLTEEEAVEGAVLLLNAATLHFKRPYITATTLEDGQGRNQAFWNKVFAQSDLWYPTRAVKSLHGNYQIYVWEHDKE